MKHQRLRRAWPLRTQRMHKRVLLPAHEDHLGARTRPRKSSIPRCILAVPHLNVHIVIVDRAVHATRLIESGCFARTAGTNHKQYTEPVCFSCEKRAYGSTLFRMRRAAGHLLHHHVIVPVVLSLYTVMQLLVCPSPWHQSRSPWGYSKVARPSGGDGGCRSWPGLCLLSVPVEQSRFMGRSCCWCMARQPRLY